MLRCYSGSTRKYLPIILFSFTFLFIPGFKLANTSVDPLNLIRVLSEKTENIKTCDLTILLKERINGDYQVKKADFKINNTPFKLFMKEEYPRTGLEVLYVEGENNNRAWVKPNSFPWITLNLDPLSNIMRNEQHHSIFKSGFSFFVEVLGHLENKYKGHFKDMLVYNGLVKYNNVVCYKVTFTNPGFKYIEYTVGEGENLEKLSYKLMVNDYLIKELNPQITSFNYLEEGQKIIVPNDYGASFIIYIDTKTNLLAGVKVFNEKGLWEEYSYSNVKVNPVFTPSDFNVNNPDYSF